MIRCVLEYHLKPGEEEAMHSHPAGVVYVLSGAKLRFTFPDGKTEERAAAAGEAIWREPRTLVPAKRVLLRST